MTNHARFSLRFLCWLRLPDVPQDPALGVHLQGHDGEAVLPQHLHRRGVARPHALQPARPAVQRDRAVSVLPVGFLGHSSRPPGLGVKGLPELDSKILHSTCGPWPYHFPLQSEEGPALFIFRKTSLSTILK